MLQILFATNARIFLKQDRNLFVYSWHLRLKKASGNPLKYIFAFSNSDLLQT